MKNLMRFFLSALHKTEYEVFQWSSQKWSSSSEITLWFLPFPIFSFYFYFHLLFIYSASIMIYCGKISQYFSLNFFQSCCILRYSVMNPLSHQYLKPNIKSFKNKDLDRMHTLQILIFALSNDFGPIMLLNSFSGEQSHGFQKSIKPFNKSFSPITAWIRHSSVIATLVSFHLTKYLGLHQLKVLIELWHSSL